MNNLSGTGDSMNLVFFLLQVFVISFSGAMQPGPVTATVITMGTRNRYAGTLLALGHGIIEFPLMVLIMVGMETLLKSNKIQIVISLLGGIFLLTMAIQMIRNLRAGTDTEVKVLRNKPLLAGVILSVGNPYFLIWWATVGAKLASGLKDFEAWAFALFALAHWSVDLIWLQILSWASFKGSKVFAPRTQRIVLLICALALLGFGLLFIYSAAAKLLNFV
jgi:threonine/homoserine/homoserine lactone efflux protein